MPLFIVRDERRLPWVDARVVYGKRSLRERLLGKLFPLDYSRPVRRVKGKPHRYEIVTEKPGQWEQASESFASLEYALLIDRAARAGMESVIIPLRTALPGFMVDHEMVRQATETVRRELETVSWRYERELCVWLLLPEGTPRGADQVLLGGAGSADDPQPVQSGAAPAEPCRREQADLKAEEAFWADLHDILQRRERLQDTWCSCVSAETLREKLLRARRLEAELRDEHARLASMLDAYHDLLKDPTREFRWLDDMFEKRLAELESLEAELHSSYALMQDASAPLMEVREQDDSPRSMPGSELHDRLAEISAPEPGDTQPMPILNADADLDDTQPVPEVHAAPMTDAVPPTAADVPAWMYDEPKHGGKKGGSLLGRIRNKKRRKETGSLSDVQGSPMPAQPLYKAAGTVRDEKTPDWRETTGGWSFPETCPDTRSAVQPADRLYGELEALLASLDESFHEMLFRLIDERNMTEADCYNRANVDRRAFAKLRSNRDHIPKKTTVAAYCIALKLDWETACELLAKAGYSMTNASKFDVILRFCIKRKMYDVDRVNILLMDNDQPLLGSSYSERPA